MKIYSDEDIMEINKQLALLQGYMETACKALEQSDQEKREVVTIERQRCLSAATVPPMVYPNQATAQSIVNAVVYAWRAHEGDWNPAQIVHQVREALDKVCEQVATGTAAAIALEIQTGGKV